MPDNMPFNEVDRCVQRRKRNSTNIFARESNDTSHPNGLANWPSVLFITMPAPKLLLDMCIAPCRCLTSTVAVAVSGWLAGVSAHSPRGRNREIEQVGRRPVPLRHARAVDGKDRLIWRRRTHACGFHCSSTDTPSSWTSLFIMVAGCYQRHCLTLILGCSDGFEYRSTARATPIAALCRRLVGGDGVPLRGRI